MEFRRWVVREGPAGQRPGKVGCSRRLENQGRGLGARQEVSHSCRAEVTGLIPRPSGKGRGVTTPPRNPSRPFFPVLPPVSAQHSCWEMMMWKERGTRPLFPPFPIRHSRK